ncbi:MAG: hypothetical protein LC789_04840 [Actinobacteria bacterium]|nr:hypothetical protein [Actinomycetota bacterium]MCA1721769.1 hypothetical protein [Actinomycetota bacterium]
MTGTTGTAGQVGRSTAVLAAGSLLAALGLSACGSDVAKAATVLRDARATTLTLTDGSTRAAGNGTTVPKGATVTTAPGGSASLVTAGRVVLLGSDTAVSVFDGRRERLRKGLVMVDARKAGDLDLDAGAATVRSARGTLARVERGPLLRIASFRKGATVRATGRRAQVPVPALMQVQVPYGGAPGQVTALGLTRDRWEKRYALALVNSDVALTQLADGLDRDAVSSSAVVRAASFRPAAADERAGQPASERSLGLLLAEAGRGGSAASRYDRIRTYRADGGSWGVVAALVRADVADVSAGLDTVLAPTDQVLAAEPSDGTVDVGGVLGIDPGTGTPDAGPAPSSGPGSSPGPTRSPSPRPSPSGSPDPVQQVVTTVQSLLPTPLPLPLPSVSAVPVAPLVSPSPLLQLDVGGGTLGIG